MKIRHAALSAGMIIYALMCHPDVPFQPEETNHPPYFGANQDRTAFVNELYTFAVSAADPDSDTIAFNCISKPANATFNQNTSVFSWVPSAIDTGLTEIIISATDGRFTVFDTIGIVVKPVGNHLPQIEPHPRHWIAYVNEELSVEIRTTNPPDDSVTIGVLSRPVGSRSIEAFYTGTVTYLYTPGINDIGFPFAVIFSAWNSSGFVYDTITFEVQQK